MWDIEKQLGPDFTATNNIQEDKAVFGEKCNPNSSPAFAAEELRKQYNSVYAPPRPAWSVSSFSEHFKVEEIENGELFSHEDIVLN